MSTVAVAVSAVLAVLLSAAAVRKLTHSPAVVASYRRAGVPEERLNLLAVILLAGAAGLLAGIVWAPIGIASAIGLIGYFAGAVVSHIRADDRGRIVMPVGYGLLAVAALVLRLVTVS